MLSTLFNLLLASIIILLCFFFLFLVAFNNFFTSPVHNEDVILKLALGIPIGAPITIANDAMEMLALVTDKTSNICQNNQKRDIFTKFFL